jgi:very-short-patch-repair endonuclease
MAEMITRVCEQCKTAFQTRLSETKRKSKSDGTSRFGRFCSKSCFSTWQKSNQVAVTCTNCSKVYDIPPCRVNNPKKKGSNRFCSQSCAASYNNKHKTHGTRRSKLEAYLESQLRTEFPTIVLICNSKDAIDSELDFYFPQLRLAIELNGIFHYEPIYGDDKLEKIQANDQQKALRCAAAGIEFCTIDISTVDNITVFVKERYWTIVKNLVTPLLGRANNTAK